MPQSYRYLSLAFVASDLLLELDEERTVRFAAGAAACPGVDASSVYMGRPLEDVVCRNSAWEVRSRLGGLEPGQRTGPIEVMGRCSDGKLRKATLRAFCAPQLAPSVSLGLTWDGLPVEAGAPAPLLDTDAFVHRARQALDAPPEPMAVAFVEVPGLSRSPAADIFDVVAAALQDASMDGQSAAQLSDERFAVLRTEHDQRDLATLLREACAAEKVTVDPVVDQARIALETDPGAALRALRFAIAECLADGPGKSAASFAECLKQTMQEAAAFRTAARDASFDIHFQPIVDLATGAAHHHEVLARFPGGDTGELIRMAEELDLIRGFDLAVLNKTLAALRLPGAGLTKLAMNLSGNSLLDDVFVETLLRRTSAEPADRRRLLMEITETAALADMPAARARLTRLREAGVKVCIDDFGSGAASYEYLRTLPIDVVKLDGRLTRAVMDDERSRTMVGHLVELCRSLGVKTVAEQVENQLVADVLQGLGVDMGQGWHFGKPSAEIVTRRSVPPRARRTGEVAAWG